MGRPIFTFYGCRLRHESLSRQVGGRRGESGWGVRVSPEGAALYGPQSDKVELAL